MGAASLQHRTPLLTQKETKRPDRNYGQKRAELAPAASGCVWFQPELAWLATSRTSRVDYLLPRQQQEQRTAAAGSTHENTAGRVLRLHRIQREYAYPVSLAIKSRIGLGRVPVKNDARTFSLAAAPALWIRPSVAAQGWAPRTGGGKAAERRWAKCGKQIHTGSMRKKKVTGDKWSIKCVGRSIKIDFCVLGGVSTTNVGDLVPAYRPYSIQVDLSWVVP